MAAPAPGPSAPAAAAAAPLIPVVNTDLDLATLNSGVDLKQWFNDKIASKTELQQLGFAKAIIRTSETLHERNGELSNACYEWVKARGDDHPIWTATRVSRNDFLQLFSLEQLQDQAMQWTKDQERKDQATNRVLMALNRQLIGPIINEFGNLWPPKPAQEFLRVLAKVASLLKTVDNIKTSVQPIINKRIAGARRPKDVHMLIGDLCEIQEYKDWKATNETRRKTDRQRREAGGGAPPPATRKRRRTNLDVSVIEGDLGEGEDDILRVKEGDVTFRIPRLESIAQAMRMSRIKREKPIPTKEVITAAATAAWLIIEQCPARTAELVSVVVFFFETEGYNNHISVAVDAALARLKEDGAEVVLTEKEREVAEEACGELYLTPTPESEDMDVLMIEAAIDMINDWSEELDKSRAKKKKEFGVKFAADRSGVVKRLWMNDVGQMYAMGDNRRINYVLDDETETRTNVWQRVEEAKQRKELAKVRRSDAYLEEAIARVIQRESGDVGYRPSGEEMSVFKNSIKALFDATEGTFGYRLKIMEEFCKYDRIHGRRIPEDDTLKSDRITTMSDDEEEDEIESDYEDDEELMKE